MPPSHTGNDLVSEYSRVHEWGTFLQTAWGTGEGSYQQAHPWPCLPVPCGRGPPRPRWHPLCCPGGLGSTELGGQEKSPQPWGAQVTTWGGQKPGLPGCLAEVVGAGPCSQLCPNRQEQSPAPLAAVGTAQPSLAEPGCGRSPLSRGEPGAGRMCSAPWGAWLGSCQAGYTCPPAGGSSAAAWHSPSSQSRPLKPGRQSQ